MKKVLPIYDFQGTATALLNTSEAKPKPLGTGTADKAIRDAKEELYAAIQAIEDGDLPYARSSSLRAANYVTEAWQHARRSNNE